ncbi:hypothetical protein PLESTB_000337500 [Pleodorina starrii]|uniref:Uncharacterized protein n=1 Tax=Pleodorina starrii TaxID=330485 RepID=A0A9W6EZF2_9CHLO|nr:hypothetical protein PLESTB_000337500 [Pleodorina starrii]
MEGHIMTGRLFRMMSAGINITVIKDAYKLGLDQSYVYKGICITLLLYAWMKMICDAKVNDDKAFEELQESKPEAFEQLCDYILHITIGNGFNNRSCKYKTSKKPAFAVLMGESPEDAAKRLGQLVQADLTEGDQLQPVPEGPEQAAADLPQPVQAAVAGGGDQQRAKHKAGAAGPGPMQRQPVRMAEQGEAGEDLEEQQHAEESDDGGVTSPSTSPLLPRRRVAPRRDYACLDAGVGAEEEEDDEADALAEQDGPPDGMTLRAWKREQQKAAKQHNGGGRSGGRRSAHGSGGDKQGGRGRAGAGGAGPSKQGSEGGKCGLSGDKGQTCKRLRQGGMEAV